MIISDRMRKMISSQSPIRKMFEEGNRLKKIYGEDNVYDFSLGNPSNEPPAAFQEYFQELAEHPIPGMHGYMSNSGYQETRQALADYISRRSGRQAKADDIVMTVGASGGINCILKAILEPGDEVLIMVPYFVDYNFYIENHGGVVKTVETRSDFQLDLEKIASAIGPKTKGIIINSPNNPTGVIYSPESLTALGRLLADKGKEFGREIILISDEPYARIVFDGNVVPHIFKYVQNSIIATSFSKDLALPGERIGYVAVNPEMTDAELMAQGITIANRMLGYVNAPALMQRLITRLTEETVDIGEYQAKRDLLYQALTGFGYQMTKPEGAFYFFPNSPTPDEMVFINRAQELNLLVVPGSAFGRKGHFRIAFCCDKGVIERSLPTFKTLAKEFGLCR